jgi:drug/metabolite transporter (DMT)-like permease
MICPLIIKIFFGLAFAGAICYPIYVTIVEYELSEDPPNILNILIPTFLVWSGLVVLRILLECAILFFRVNETLTEIRQLLKDSRFCQ